MEEVQTKFFNNNSTSSSSNKYSLKIRRVVVNSRSRRSSFKKKKCKTLSRSNGPKSKINCSSKNVKQSTIGLRTQERVNCAVFILTQEVLLISIRN